MAFEEVLSEIAGCRAALEQNLLLFAETDTLLFLPESERIKQALGVANRLLNTSFELAQGIDVPQINKNQQKELLAYMENAALRKFAILYLTATELRSVLLAVLFVEDVLSVDEVFELAFYEELLQQQKWGVAEDILLAQQVIKQKLAELENYKHNENLFTH